MEKMTMFLLFAVSFVGVAYCFLQVVREQRKYDAIRKELDEKNKANWAEHEQYMAQMKEDHEQKMAENEKWFADYRAKHHSK